MAETSPDPATPLAAAAAVHRPLPATSLPPATPPPSVAALGPSPSSGLLDYSATTVLPSDLCSGPNSCTPLTHHPCSQPFAGSCGSNDSGTRQQQTRSSQGPASHSPRFPHSLRVYAEHPEGLGLWPSFPGFTGCLGLGISPQNVGTSRFRKVRSCNFSLKTRGKS